MRGEREQKCLDRVANSFNSGKLYGLSCEDMEFLDAAIRSAQPNPNSSRFPDFVCDGGIIEHFMISSSKTTAKGSKQQKEYKAYRTKTDKEIEAFKVEPVETDSLVTVDSRNWSFQQPEHCYDYLAVSFRNTWESHIESLKSYSSEFGKCIFMIDYDEIALQMIEDVFESVKTNLCYDDLRDQQKMDTYRLSRDKDMLEYVYSFRDRVDMIIFAFFNGWEAIKLESIPELLKLMPWRYRIEPLIGTINVETVYRTRVRCCDE